MSGAGPRAAFYALSDAGARGAYADLLAVSPQRTVFAGLVYADAVCSAFGMTGRIALATGAEGEPGIGAVLFEKQRGPFRQAVVPPLTPYTGPLFSGGAETAERIRTFLAAVAARYDAVAFHLSPAVTDVRPFV
ncbi:MAG TPA: hypothetical protein VF576_12085, partial [Rubricoccaceae bacterium]